MATFDDLYADWKKRRDANTSAFDAGYEEWKRRNKKQDEEEDEIVQQQDNSKIIDEISTRVNTWLENSGNYANLAKTRFSNYDPNEYRGNTSNFIDAFTQYNNNFTREAVNIVSLLDTYKDIINPEYAKSVKKALEEGNKAHSSYLDLATKDNDYWSQWDNAESYLQYRKEVQDYQDLLNYDTDKGQKEVDALQAKLEKKKDYEYKTFWPNMTDEDRLLLQQEMNLSDYDLSLPNKDIEKEIAEKENYLTRAKWAQESEKFNSVNDPSSENYDPQFQQKSVYNPEHSSESAWYDYINSKGEKNKFVEQSHLADPRFKELNDDEIALYNYYFETEGNDAALKYLDTIRESLSYRSAERRFKDIEKLPLYEMLFGIEAGIDQFASGVGGAIQSLVGRDDYRGDVTPTAALSGMVRGDLESQGGLQGSLYRTAYDVVQNTSAQLPQILASTALSAVSGGAAGIASGALMFASAGGNAYNEARRMGYSVNQARTYGALIGASETFLEKLMGGIIPLKGGDGLFGGVSEAVLNKVDNAFARVAISGGFDMLNEFSEEYLQDVLEPVFKNIVFNEKNEVKFFSEEALYSGILGALSAGVMNAPYQVNDIAATEKTGNKIMQAEDGAKRLAELGQTFSPETLAYKIASKVDDNTGAYKIGLLFREAGAVLNDANIGEIQAALEEKGVDTDSAHTMAEAFASILNNEVITLNDDQKSVIENSELLKDAVWDELIGPNTTAYQRTKAYADIYAGTNSSTAAQTETNEAPAAETNTEAETRNESQPETKTESETEQAVNPNENVRLSDGQTLTDVKIDSTSDRNVVFTAKDESGNNVKVNLNDISLRSKSQQIMAQALATSNVSADAANSILNYSNSLSENAPISKYLAPITAYRYGKIKYEAGLSGLDMDPIEARILYNKALGERTIADKVKSALGISNGKKGKVYVEKGVSFDTDLKKATKSAAEAIALLSPLNVHLFESRVENGIRVYTDPETGKTVEAANGYVKSGTNDIYVDVNAGDKGEGFGVYTLSHEVSHYIRENNAKGWTAIADTIMENFGTDVPMEKLLADAAAQIRSHNKGLSDAQVDNLAYEEVVADAVSRILTDPTTYEKLAALKQNNPSVWQKIKTAVQKVLARLKEALGVYNDLAVEKTAAAYVDKFGSDIYNKLQDLYVKAFEEANQAYSLTQSMADAGDPIVSTEQSTESTMLDNNEAEKLHSYRSLAESLGFRAYENDDGSRIYLRKSDGTKVEKITADEIKFSPTGVLLELSVENGSISRADMNKQLQFFADLGNMAIQNNDFMMTQQFAGAVMFTGLKANADKQYGTTFDFESICLKTKDIINRMSAMMTKLGRGLNESEIKQLYDDIGNDKNPVPCPECYVFTHWVGIGGLLDNINNYQTQYGKMSPEQVRAEYQKMYKVIEEHVTEMQEAENERAAAAGEKPKTISFGKSKGNLASKYTKEFNKVDTEINTLENKGEDVPESLRLERDNLEKEMTTVKAMTWIEKVYFSDSAMTKVNPRRNVPNNILFDLNAGNAFAYNYPEAWNFRCTQGAGYGKAITPYAEEVLGEGIMGVNQMTKTAKSKAAAGLAGDSNESFNIFLRAQHPDLIKNMTGAQKAQAQKDLKQARESLKAAKNKQLAQLFLGGQRFSSTSDAKNENSLDFLLAFLELQAMSGGAQVYTKVSGAVPGYSLYGAFVNQSLMPLGCGLQVNPDGTLALDENGLPILADTSIGGMGPTIARENRNNNRTAGTITIGVNDLHIRALLQDSFRDFVIPYHVSGGRMELINYFRQSQERQASSAEKKGQTPTIVRSSDYTKTQSEKVLSDTLLKKLGKTDEEIKAIKARREARLAILTGKGKIDMDVVRDSKFLSKIYDEFHSGKWQGAKIQKNKVEEQIYPNEYWDTSVTYDQSRKITEDYLAYCEELGFLHKFSGQSIQHGQLTPVSGYDYAGNKTMLTDLAYKYDENGNKTDQVEDFFWKVLVDRRMFDNDGNYIEQLPVTLRNLTTSDVENFAKNNVGISYDKAKSQAAASKINPDYIIDNPAHRVGRMMSTRAQKYEDYNEPITQSDIETLRSINQTHPEKSIKIFTSEDIQKSQKWAHKFYQELGTKSPFFCAWFGDWRANSKDPIAVAVIPEYVPTNEARKANRGTYKNTDTGWNIAVTRDGESNTISHSGEARLSEYGLAGIKSLIENAILLDTEVHDHHSNNAKNDNIAFDHKLYALGNDESGAINLYKITVEEYYQSKSEPNKRRFHNLRYIEKVAEVPADALARKTRSGGSTMESSTTKYNISDLYSFVKQFDKDFTAGKEISPKLLNEDGTPKVVYHGTPSKRFNIFNYDNIGNEGGSEHGYGFYFTGSRKEAQLYTQGKSDTIIEAYLSMHNPIIAMEKVSSSFLDELFNRLPGYARNALEGEYGSIEQAKEYYLNRQYDTLLGTMPKRAGMHPEVFNNILQNMNYDGVIYDDGEFAPEYVVFSSGQIKSATDNIGTFDGSNPDIRYSERASNAELAQRDDTAVYIKDTDKADYIRMIFSGAKTEETRAQRTLDDFIGKRVPVTDGKMVYGEVVFGEPHKYTAEEFHKRENQLKHRVPAGDTYDIKDGGTKWAYPIVEYTKYSKPRKLSDSKDYKYSYQARQTLYSERTFENPVTGENVRYSLRKEDPPKKTLTGYKVFVVKDGKLYPPMVANPNAEDTPVGVWLNADIGAQAPASKTGRLQVKAGGKGTQGGSGSLAFRPGWHLGETPLATQFDRTNPETGVKEMFPENFVWAECEIAADIDYQEEAMSYGYNKNGKFQHSLAGLPKLPVDGYYRYRTNPNPDTVPWLITGAMKVNRVLSDAEVNEILAEKGIAPKKRLGGDKTLADLGLVQYEGKRFSERNTGGDFSNRALLSNALSSVANTDTEKSMLERYQKNVTLMDNEQKRLDGIRAHIRELSFAKGPRQTEKINELRQTAKQIESKINAYDKKLLSLEAASPIKAVLERERKAAFAKAEEAGKQYVREVRQQMTEKLQSVAERYQESRHQAVVNRHRTEIRNQIRSTVSKLNQLLLTNSKDRHVPLELQKSVADALSAINMDTVGADERIAKIDEQIARAKTDEQRAKLLATRQRIANAGTNLGDRLSRLQTSYAAIQQSEDPTVRDSYDDVIAALIENTVSQVGDKSIRNMSLEELESVRDMYRAIMTRVRDANKLFKAQRQQTISEASEAVKEEISATGKVKSKQTRAGKSLSEFAWSLLKPIYAMKAIGSDTLTGLYNQVRNGEDKWVQNVHNARDYYMEEAKKYGLKNWDMEKTYTFEDSEGKSFSLSLPQIMSLYAYSRRDQAGEHLAKGGFILGDNIEVQEKKNGIPVKYLVNDTTPYTLSERELNQVIGALTPNQKAFVEDMQAYLSQTMGALGNEVSREMYGIDLFKEKYYFPLKTSNFFRDFDPEKANGQPKMKNKSFTNSLVKNASNPIVLDNFMDVWAGHANEMSMYNAFALPLEDFSRVYSYYTSRGGYDSVKQSIRQAYGDAAGTYIERMIMALNGGARSDPSAGMANRLISLFKKGATFASASVVIQQPSALPRAFAYIAPKYFAGLKQFNPARHKQLWNEVKQYAPVAMIKEMGYFDVNNGMSTTEWIQAPEYETAGEKFKAFFQDSNYRDEVLSKAPAMADEITWTWIWEAAKKQVAAKEGLTGEALLRRAGELFTETITNTQVYDSVLSRSEIMRSKDTAVKMATAFMAEPITSLNMMIDAIRNGKAGNKAAAAQAVGSVVSSIILNSVLVSLVYAARKRDDDKTYEEKYLNSLTSEILEGINPITYIPYLKDIWSIAQGFDVERSDMSVVSDLWESIEKLFSTSTSGLDKVLNVTGAIGTTLGLPVTNLIRDAKALYNVFSAPAMPTTQAGIQSAIREGVIDSIPLAGRFIGSPSKAEKLYEAATSGDQAQYERMMAQYGNDQSKVDAALRAQLRANDPRIRAAAEAYNAGDVNEYVDNLNKIVSEGVFPQDLVYKAITAEASAIKSAEPSDEETEPQTPKETSIYKAAHAAEAIRSGDTNLMKTVIDDLVRVKEANGSTEKDAKTSVKSSITSALKPIYMEAYATKNDALMKTIRQGMVASGLYGKADDVVKTCQNWIKS